jgi:hypothetical protein
MSKLTRTLVVAATLATISLVAMTADAQATDDPVGQPPTERQVGEAWRHGQAASQQQTAADTSLQRVQARERSSIPNATPAQPTAPATQPNRPPAWLPVTLGVLAVLMLVAGLVVPAARRASRRARLGTASLTR